MAKFKLQKKSVDRTKAAIKRKLHRVIRDDGVLKHVAGSLVKEIQRRGAVDENGEVSGKEISDKWNKRRKRLSKFNATSKHYKPSTLKSFLTFTGQLMKSIKAKINITKGIITIEPTGVHKKYKTGKRNKSKNIRNVDLLNALEDKGYYFLVANDKLRKKVVNLIKIQLRKVLKK